jgi:Flp pilus assembly pilin Flp
MPEFKPKKGKKGQSIVEYVLILVLVSMVVIAALGAWGGHVNTSVNHLENALNSVNKNITSTT